MAAAELPLVPEVPLRRSWSRRRMSSTTLARSPARIASLISEVNADSCRASSTFSAATMGSGLGAADGLSEALLLFEVDRPLSLLRDRFKLGGVGTEEASVAAATAEATAAAAAVVAGAGAGRPRAAVGAAGGGPGDVDPEVLRAMVCEGKPPPPPPGDCGAETAAAAAQSFASFEKAGTWGGIAAIVAGEAAGFGRVQGGAAEG